MKFIIIGGKMKKSILKTLSIMAIMLMAIVSCSEKQATQSQNTTSQKSAAIPTNDNVESFQFDDFNLHVYMSAEAMGDVSLVVEGANAIIIIEPQSFYNSIEDFDNFVAQLGKPVEKIVANYHAGGLANYSIDTIAIVEPMIAFMQSPPAVGMLAYFDNAFGGAMDTRIVPVNETIPTTSNQNWVGIEFDFTPGAATDFPASSINIGNKVFYTHFAPNRMHPSPMQITSAAALDATIAELKKAQSSGCEIYVGSHGLVATLDDVEFVIDYLQNMQTFRASNADAQAFILAVEDKYSELMGSENLTGIAANLYK